MDFDFSFSPILPPIVLYILCGLTLVFLGLAGWKKLRGWGLRLSSFLILLTALLNPLINFEEHENLSNIVFLVNDTTQSQHIANRDAQVKKALTALRSKIGTFNNFELREITVENDLVARNDGSMVLTALSAAAAELPANRTAGAIIITDGRIHDQSALSEFPAPVHVILTGEKDDWDQRLSLINAPSFAIIDEEINLRLEILESGNVPASQSGSADLKIIVDGTEYGTFTLPTNKELELPLRIEHGGANIVQFEVIAEDGELTDRNNTAVLSINGVRDRLRVLLVSGEPHSGERTWRNLLKSDSAVDLVHFTILRTQDKLDGVPVRELSLIAFPTRQLFSEKIEEFDLIIFDRYKRRGMLASRYLDNVVEYTKNGGAVLVATGEYFAGAESLHRTSLSEILPAVPTQRVIERGYHPKISKLGQKHPVTEDLDSYGTGIKEDPEDPDWGRWFRLVEVEPTRGDVVMTGVEDKPLLILDRVEEGRVALLLSDHAWLWSRGFEGGGPQLEMLRRLAHWMMKEPDLEEERLSAESDGSTIFVKRRSILEDPRELIVISPNGAETPLEMNEVSPGNWSAEFEGEENGLYRLKDGEAEAIIAIGPVLPQEFEQVVADPGALEPLMISTSGGVLNLHETPEPKLRVTRQGRVAKGRDWLGLVDRQVYVTKAVTQTPLLPEWVYLLLAALLAVGAWWYEGRRV